MAMLNTTLQVIRDKIEEKDGIYNVKMEVVYCSICDKIWWYLFVKPKVVTDVDDEELKSQFEALERANEERPGDDDESDAADDAGEEDQDT